jgi:hypothetical protein
MHLRPRIGDRADPQVVRRSQATLNDILGILMLGGFK